MAYTKLFSSIVTSTIWLEDDQTRIVWITMLALADKDGEVQGSIPGLARIAGVSVESCRAAIAKFLSPDPDSRTKTEDGRRVEEIDGGWAIINYGKYRDMATSADRTEKAAARQRRKRARDKQNCHATVTPQSQSVTPKSHQNCQAEAEADTETEAKTIKKEKEPFKLPKELDSPEFLAVWQNWKRHRMEKHKPLGEIEEQAQLMELIRFGQEAIAVVSFSIRTGALNLICNGDHKPPSKKSTAKTGGVDWSKFGIEAKQ